VTELARRPDIASQRRGTRRSGTAPLVIVTDALPGVHAEAPTDGLVDDPLMGALATVNRQMDGTWIGRGAVVGSEPDPGRRRPVRLDPEQAGAHHDGHVPRTIWSVYHDLGTARFEQRWRDGFRAVNATYAAAVVEEAARGAMVWIQDPRLQLVPGLVRRKRPDLRIGLHLSIPFPAADLFLRLPMREELLRSLLCTDLLGFQTAGAAENFLRLSHEATIRPPSVSVFPTAADTPTITALAARTAVRERAQQLRQQLGHPATVLLSINQPDETQGIQRRLHWFGDMLDQGHLAADEVALVQIVLAEPGSGTASSDFAGAAARVNGRHAAVGRPCVHYLLARPDLAERVALYLAADVMLATPLREGATTAALEFAAAARPDSALILSEFSGSASVLPGAHLVNPHDDDAVRNQLRSALHGPEADRVARMAQLRAAVREYDSHTWAGQFLATLAGIAPGVAGADRPHWSPRQFLHDRRQRRPGARTLRQAP